MSFELLESSRAGSWARTELLRMDSFPGLVTTCWPALSFFVEMTKKLVLTLWMYYGIEKMDMMETTYDI